MLINTDRKMIFYAPDCKSKEEDTYYDNREEIKAHGSFYINFFRNLDDKSDNLPKIAVDYYLDDLLVSTTLFEPKKINTASP